jgi:hypothetical protein
MKLSEQIVIRKMGEWLHETLLTMTNFVLLKLSRSAFEARNASSAVPREIASPCVG